MNDLDAKSPVSSFEAQTVRSPALVVILCFVVFIFYQVLIFQSPALYWMDPHMRVALGDQLFIGEWLPAIQIFVVLASRITASLTFLRVILSILAIASLVCLYVLARRIFSHLTGLIAFAFLAFNMMFAALATVPYPEVLFIGLVFAALKLLDEPLFTRRFYIGLVVLNIACLTRYEGWLFSAIFIAEIALKLFRTLQWRVAAGQTLKMALLSSASPLAWLFVGISQDDFVNRFWSIFHFSTGTTALSMSQHILDRTTTGHLQGFFDQYLHLLNRLTHFEFLLLGIVGFLFAIFNKSYHSVHWRIPLFLVLDLCVLVFIQPMAFGNLRQPFLLQAFLILYAAYGLTEGVNWLFQRLSLLIKSASYANWATWVTVMLAILLSIRLISSTRDFVIESSHQTLFFVPYEVGAWLNSHLAKEDAILILDDTVFYPYALATYTEYPFEDILDDRYDALLIRKHLDAVGMVYVIELYTSRSGLSPAEMRILEDLESDSIQAKKVVLGSANIWYAPANEIHYLQ